MDKWIAPKLCKLSCSSHAITSLRGGFAVLLLMVVFLPTLGFTTDLTLWLNGGDGGSSKPVYSTHFNDATPTAPTAGAFLFDSEAICLSANQQEVIYLEQGASSAHRVAAWSPSSDSSTLITITDTSSNVLSGNALPNWLGNAALNPSDGKISSRQPVIPVGGGWLAGELFKF